MHERTLFLPLALLAAGSVVACASNDADTPTEPEAPAETQAEPEEPAEPEWVALFNGENLDGWQVKITGFPLGENHANTFRVEDGLLRVRYDGYETFDGKFGHIFYEQPFSSYDLRIVYRFVGEQVPGGPGWAVRNSGVMLHGQSAESMGVDQDFPASIEAQMLGGITGGGERSTANLCTPGTNVVINEELITRHCTDSSAPTFRDDEWVTFEVQVRGNGTIRHVIDGEVVLEYQTPQLDPRDGDAQKLIAAGADPMLSSGTISLQAESHPVDFKSIEIRVLD